MAILKHCRASWLPSIENSTPLSPTMHCRRCPRRRCPRRLAPSDATPTDVTLANIVEQMADEYRQQGDVDLATWQARYPQVASEIARLVPTIELLAELSCARPEGTSAAAAAGDRRRQSPGRLPHRARNRPRRHGHCLRSRAALAPPPRGPENAPHRGRARSCARCSVSRTRPRPPPPSTIPTSSLSTASAASAASTSTPCT